MSSAVYRFATGAAVIALFSAAVFYNVTNAASGTRVQSPNNALSDSTKEFSEATKKRIREGTIIQDQTGFFRSDGEGATFVSDEGLEFGGLPNLNLERVVGTLKTAEEPKSIRWIVSGMTTEFSGRNYLLISRAIFKSKPPPPAPEQLSN